MEDNEFEEVTIISHTDQAASILPQQTAERLMKEIRMEVTQKISQTENVKMGSLQHSEATTLLDKIKPGIVQIPTAMNICQLYFLSNRLTELLVSSTNELFRISTNPPATNKIAVPTILEEDSSDSDEFYEAANIGVIVCWRDHLYIFKMRGPIEVYDLQFNHVKTISEQQCASSRGWGVVATDDRLYFISAASSLLSPN